jgi:beta-lactam-binding protein with PASTA domain
MSELDLLVSTVSEDMEVALYETMPIEQVKAELKQAGIDSGPTIAAVTRLIESTLASRQDAKKRR